MSHTNGMPMMLITIPEEIQGHFKKYVQTRPNLSQAEKNMMEYYYSDDSLMQIMAGTFFEQWEPVRNFTVYNWTMNVIEELLSVLEVLDP